MQPAQTDSPASWGRLAVAMALSTIGGAGLWTVVVVLPAVQAEFGADRGSASMAYTLTMLGFAAGGVFMGRLSDRFGIMRPVMAAIVALALGYVLAGLSFSLWQFSLIQGVLIGALGSATTFGPLLADVSLWFRRRRGIAMALCASGNYLAGTFWPPVVQHVMAGSGWRTAYIGVGLFCAVTMLPLALLLRRKPPASAAGEPVRDDRSPSAMGLSPGALQAMLVLAGLTCCIAMATPQVHIVAYCADLGYGPAPGAAMLSLMLGFGVVSRVGSGFLADRIGGLPTALLGSVLQAAALLLYVRFDGLASLYLISALFGLVQGGIVPSYAVVVRESFPTGEAGTRIGLTMMATVIGMAVGGWFAGAVDDWTGSYRASFAAGVAWNAVNVAILLMLLLRQRQQGFPTLAARG
ncbi:MAG TPA: MFS transporter [Acetobacteraceae bacterium]|nr:MFS transporter [Acetobacteraceae bacterium]